MVLDKYGDNATFRHAELMPADARLIARKPEKLSMHEAAALPLVGITAYEGLGATPIDYAAEAVEDYVATHTGGAGFDVVFDSVGGGNLTKSFAAAKLNGHVATVGEAYARLSGGTAIGKVVVDL